MRNHQQVNQSPKSPKFHLHKLLKLVFDIDIVHSFEWTYIILTHQELYAKTKTLKKKSQINISCYD